ncbi:MAG: hypothetical protein WCE62_00695 [Polyangiales bacterium]
MSRGSWSWSAWGCAAAFFALGAFPLYSIDAYGHLAQGRQIAELGRVPTLDPFSFWRPTPQPWSNYEWAYDLATWLIYDHLGPSALILIKCLLLAALGYMLVLLACRLARGAELAGPLAAVLLISFAPLARIRFTVRPQIIGLVLLAVLLLGISALYSERTSGRARRWVLIALGLMQVLWVNMHGSHLLGVLVTVLFAGFSIGTPALRWMLGLLVVQLAATACTPFGIGIVTDALSHAFRPEYRELVTEWGPWSPEHPLYLLVGPMISAVLVLVAMRPVTGSSRFGLAYGVFCVVVSFMGFRSIRFVAHQLLFTAPLVAAGLAQLRPFRGLSRAARILFGFATVSALWVAPRLEPFVPFGFGEPRLGHGFEVAAVINETVQDPRILAPIQESWPLMFAVPKGRFLVDGRVPFYGPSFIRQVTDSFSDPAALSALLEAYEVNTVVLDHTRADQRAAVEYLWRAPGWSLGQVQDRQSLFVRLTSAPALIPLTIIGPGYRVGRLLEAGVPDAEVETEAGRVGYHHNSKAIQGWIQGLIALRPLARDGERAGVRICRSAEERQSARQAYQSLSVAAEIYPGFDAIELYRAMAAIAACDVPQAREALGRAAYSGETRETSLLALELALRTDNDDAQRAAALAHLDRLLAHPETSVDPWVVAIGHDRNSRCP